MVSDTRSLKTVEAASKLTPCFEKLDRAFGKSHSKVNGTGGILLRDADVFGLGEKTQGFLATFAADAALFHAAEGNAEIADEPAVYPDSAGVDFFSDAMGAVQILRPNTRREAVVAVVRVANHFVLAVERSDRDDGTEDLLAVCPAGNGKIGENRGRKEITLTTPVADRLRDFAAQRDLAAFFLREIDVELHLVELRLAHD